MNKQRKTHVLKRIQNNNDGEKVLTAIEEPEKTADLTNKKRFLLLSLLEVLGFKRLWSSGFKFLIKNF